MITTIPTSIFIAITVLMMCMTIYTLHVPTHTQKIFGGMISTIMAFMLSQQIVSGNVVTIITRLNSADVPLTNKDGLVIPELSYILLFIAVIMSLITAIFIIKYVMYLYDESQKKRRGTL